MLFVQKNMTQRITIMFDDELVKKLRSKQADLLKKTNKSISFSFIVNETVKKGLK